MMVETNTLLIVASVIQTLVGGVMSYLAIILGHMRSDAKENLRLIHDAIAKLTDRVEDVEQISIRSDEWRKGYTGLIEGCSRRFDRLDQEVAKLRDRRPQVGM